MRCATGHKVVVVTLDTKGAWEWRPHFLLRPELSSKRAGLWDEEGGNRLFVCVCVSATSAQTMKVTPHGTSDFLPRSVCYRLSTVTCFSGGSLGIVWFFCLSFLVSHQFVLCILGVQVYILWS